MQDRKDLLVRSSKKEPFLACANFRHRNMPSYAGDLHLLEVCVSIDFSSS